MRFTPVDILDAAVELIDARGIGVSTASIAAAAGVSNGTLFHYFRTKQDLLDALYVHLKRGLAHAIGTVDTAASARERASLIWDRWIDWGVASPAHHRVMLLLKGGDLISASAADEAAALLAPSTDVLADAATDGLLAEMPLPYLAATVEAQIDLAVVHRLSTAARALAFEMAWASITARPAA